VNQLGLSARAFSQARLTLAAPPAKPAAAPAPPAKAEPAQPPAAAAASAPAAAATAAAPVATSFSDIVHRYGGWYPFVGLAGVIAVSKEVIILNESVPFFWDLREEQTADRRRARISDPISLFLISFFPLSVLVLRLQGAVVGVQLRRDVRDVVLRVG
jgi:nucleoid-associated protein YgaU